MKNPELEQSICVTCGFCCDGTLFDHAILKPGEKGSLPQYMEDSYNRTGDKETFQLPCAYFNEKCSIYSQKKAIVCTAYRCQLLKDFSANEVDFDRALKIVEGGKRLRKDIFIMYSHILPTMEEYINFRLILKRLIIDQKESSENTSRNVPIEILIGKCNIFETLLVRYFKSLDDYNQMIEIEDGN